MKIDELRDMLAASWRPYVSSAVEAYRRADEDLPDMLGARKTKWAVFNNSRQVVRADGKLLIFDSYDEAEKHNFFGPGHVLPYKEPKS